MPYSEYKEMVATIATVTTILQFFSGMLVCQKFINKGTTADLSPLPFMAGFLSTVLWFCYGTMINDSHVILVNAVGMVLMSLYMCFFYLYTTRKNVLLKQLTGIMVILMLLFTYFCYEIDDHIFTNRLGFVACSMSLMFIAAPLSNLAHVIRVKNAESLPFPIILMTFFVCALWSFYGIILEDPFLQYPNMAGCMLALFQLVFFVIYPSR